jgi:Ulp1 family protease
MRVVDFGLEYNRLLSRLAVPFYICNTCPQQDNGYDCGLFAAKSCIQVMQASVQQQLLKINCLEADWQDRLDDVFKDFTYGRSEVEEDRREIAACIARYIRNSCCTYCF